MCACDTKEMPKAATPTWYIALVVVRDDDRFVLVQERKHPGWYLPAGRIEHGESLIDGAKREVLEESGLEVELDGILRIEHTPPFANRDARVRIVFVGHPVGGRLKTKPDDDTLGATWVRLSDLPHYDLRSEEVERHFGHVAGGGTIFPLSLLTWEGAPYA